jgi:hypothetical protein
VGDRIGGFEQADATRYRCPDWQRPHLVISETMKAALESEPQVAITRNLAPQLVHGGLLVPERIELHATLVDPSCEFDMGLQGIRRRREELGCIMEVDREGDRCFSVRWPEQVPSGLRPMIRTRIRVFGDLALGDYESSITLPRDLVLDPPPRPAQRLKCRYRLKPSPGLVWISSGD